MSDARFRELLGLGPGASREEIRRSWRRRVMANHPDRFPSDRKTAQELRVIALNEAYASLMALARDPKTAG
ncbi:MAG: J domain-containing protein, partial [Spirochaetes bacterium]|nr:J domain-containing protein [Spirochaetota bacterium]